MTGVTNSADPAFPPVAVFSFNGTGLADNTATSNNITVRNSGFVSSSACGAGVEFGFSGIPDFGDESPFPSLNNVVENCTFDGPEAAPETAIRCQAGQNLRAVNNVIRNTKIAGILVEPGVLATPGFSLGYIGGNHLNWYRYRYSYSRRIRFQY